jgi:enediyne biosynthesis protein E4
MLLAGCSPKPAEAPRATAPPASSSPPPAPANAVTFTEVAGALGIDFVHNNGAAGKKNMPETVGSGVAFLDYDNDGWQDLLLVNSMSWPGDKLRRSTYRLYRNEQGAYKDVTKAAGLEIELYGMGAAVGDYDNDGFQDLFLTAIGPNRLYRNTLGDAGRTAGQPVFRDVTASAGVQGVPMPGTEMRWKWSASAAWVDYDKDGKLDLFVTQYVKWSPDKNMWCGHNGVRGYCPPKTYEGAHNTLYHNDGDGKFRDVSTETGILSGPVGKSFGIAVADYNGDGWPDIAVSNDTWANFLYVNEGGKRFSERAVESGIASGEDGHFKAGMGIDCGDWRNNGRFSLLIGNFANEGLSLFDREEDLLFTDNAHVGGVHEPSLLYLTFGLFFFDYDLDGWQDIFTANGHIDDIVSTYDSMLTFKERPLLFHNERKGTFTEVGKQCKLVSAAVGRGTAYADIDNDGDLDVALFNNGGKFLLFRNEGGSRNHWLRFRTEGAKSNREGTGALIRVTQGGVTQSQYVHSGGSFLSESQRQPTFGLGGAGTADKVEVLWPSGQRDLATALKSDRQYLVTEGQGFREDPRVPHKETSP